MRNWHNTYCAIYDPDPGLCNCKEGWPHRLCDVIIQAVNAKLAALAQSTPEGV